MAHIHAKDYDLIVKIFDKYVEHTKTKVLSDSGFKRYLLQVQAFPAWLVRDVMRQIEYDENLRFHIHTYLEAYLVEGMLLGTIKDTGAKMMLKNKFGYEENPTKQIEEGKSTTKRIVFVPAQKPAQIEHKGEQ